MILREDEAVAYCRRQYSHRFSAGDLSALERHHLLPSFFDNSDKKCFFRKDLDAIVPHSSFRVSNSEHYQGPLFEILNTSRLRIGKDTTVDLPEKSTSSAYYAGVRNLIDFAATSAKSDVHLPELDVPYFAPTRLQSSSAAVLDLAKHQVSRANLIAGSRASEFANSAYYMGAKRAIAPFLVEAIQSVARDDTVVVDLMCGSGSVSGACSSFWPVLASDSQVFSRYLAVVQGGGFTAQRARNALEALLPTARVHALEVTSMLDPLVRDEDAFFRADVTERVRAEYAAFIQATTGEGATGSAAALLQTSVDERRRNPQLRPYMLFTAYFANVFFGLRQAVEIDSLRFAIDQLEDPLAREWALGTLVATASKVATSYAGHFAEPLIRDWHSVGPARLSSILDKRSVSVFHEFTVRLMNLADESSHAKYSVLPIIGPWQIALQEVSRIIGGKPAVVYIDPPYRREEYSRYYHVLETLVTYSYPSAIGPGRLPGKVAGGRFASEFFTRSVVKREELLAILIQRVLDFGWTAVWSYSNVADANIPAVISRLSGAAVSSFSAPHKHQTHGGRGRRPVTEYAMIVSPERP